MLIIDFETRSRVDLLTKGTYLYATDPSTQVLCLAAGWTEDGRVDQVQDELPQEIIDYIRDGGLVGAHNAEFDMLIWEHCTDYPPIPLEQWYCTAAQARINALPASLENATRCLFGGTRKGAAGANLIKQLSIPREDGTFNEDPKLMSKMLKYCKQDVGATIAMVNACRPLEPQEHLDWVNTVKVNTQGIFIDRDLAELAQHYASAETRDLDMDIRAHMDEFLRKNRQYDHKAKLFDISATSQGQRIKKLVLHFGDDKVRAFMTRPNGKEALDKRIRETMLLAVAAGELDLHPLSHYLIAKMHEGNVSSVAKFGNMLSRSDDAGLVQGAFLYAGASQTLRFSSKGLQLHNFKRDCYSPKDTEALKKRMFNEEPLEQVMHKMGKLLRPALLPEEGNKLVVGDWSGIEARALPWLAGTPGADKRLEIFRAGEDIYQLTADALKQPDRQIGKVAELSLGYGGAAGAFGSMANNYGVYLPENEVIAAVKNWRASNLWAVNFWNDLEHAAVRATRRPRETIQAGVSKIHYTFIPELIGGTLICTLPSGDWIQYPGAKVEGDELTAVKAAWLPAQGEKEWPRVRLWRGLLAENATQAICASLLRWAINELIEEGITPVAHVHDELVLDSATPEDDAALLQEIMEDGPDWAAGLPLAAKPAIMTRYGK